MPNTYTYSDTGELTLAAGAITTARKFVQDNRVVPASMLPADDTAMDRSYLLLAALRKQLDDGKIKAPLAAQDGVMAALQANLPLPATGADTQKQAIQDALTAAGATDAAGLVTKLAAATDGPTATAAVTPIVAALKLPATPATVATKATELTPALASLVVAAAGAEAAAKKAVADKWGEIKALAGEVDPVAAISARIAEIDLILQNQVNAILHHEKFRTLEASWRGLNYLVMKTETGERLKLRVLNVTKEELRKDLAKAVDVDQSQLFKKVYEEEYGTFGGNPMSLLVGDFDFSQSPPDVDMLERISSVAAMAHAPFIAAASPQLFGFESFAELGIPRDLAKIVEGQDWVKWRSFRETEDSRYVALVLPRFLLRQPYDPDNNPVEGLGNFRELPAKLDASILTQEPNGRRQELVKVEAKWATLGPDADSFTYHNSYLWGNAAYALAQRITNAFALHSWCAAIRGVEGGGKVEGLPVHVFRTGEKTKASKCPTEVTITDRREKELSDLGFIALCHCKNTDYAAFFGGATTQKPQRYNTPQATANARLSAALPYLLATSRFAHYLKVIMRDKVGSFASRSSVEEFLNRWIADYVLLDDHAAQSVKAKYPLREARVDVSETPGKPGCYTATAFLRPHFQLEELTVSLRLVAELPPPLTA